MARASLRYFAVPRPLTVEELERLVQENAALGNSFVFADNSKVVFDALLVEVPVYANTSTGRTVESLAPVSKTR